MKNDSKMVSAWLKKLPDTAILSVLKNIHPPGSKQFIIQGAKPRAFEYLTIPGH